MAPPRSVDLERRRFLALAGAVPLAACGDPLPAEQRPGSMPRDGDAAPSRADDGGAISSDGGPLDGPTQSPAITMLAEAPQATFPIGVASGDVDAESAVLHTRYVGTEAVELFVWREGSTTSSALPVTIADGGFVHVTASGLVAGDWYNFAFVESTANRRSPIGRFRAAFAATTRAPLVLGASACTFNFFGAHTTLDHAGKRDDLDVFLLLGDTSYNDACNSVDDYRTRWESNLSKDGYRAVRAKTSVLATWDDHEVGNNWSPETIDAGLLSRATQAFFENLPLRRVQGAPNRVWRSFRWGETAELFVLDGRSERKPSTRETPEAIYLSRAQMDWLKGALAASPAVFKILLNSVPFSNFPASFDLGKVLLDPADRWQGYKAAQEELLRFIEETPISGVVFVSGDFHLACAGRVSASGLGAKTTEVLVGPGNQVVNPLDVFLTAPQWDLAHRQKNYAAFHLDPTSRSVRVVYHGVDGKAFAEHTYVV